MKSTTGLRAVFLAVLTALLFAGLVAPANAAPPTKAAQGQDCAGRGVPLSKTSIQLYTFAGVIGNDAGSQARHEEVLRRVAEMGYRNVEPYTLSGWTAAEYAALLDEYGLKASSRHVDVGWEDGTADIAQILADNRTLGIKYFGSGSSAGAPWIGQVSTEAEWVAYAEYLDRVGEQARKAGQTLLVHNHDFEFRAVFGDRTAFDILMQHTSAKNVVSELDVYWVAFAGLDPVDVVAEYGNRVQLIHVKDLNEDLRRRIEIVGRGDIDFPSIFAAGSGRTRYYIVEHDPRFGDPTFDPYQAAREGLAYLRCVTY